MKDKEKSGLQTDPVWRMDKIRKQAGSETLSAHPELNPKIKEAIAKGEVLGGMTEDEVKASWGTPYQIVKGTEGDFYYVYLKPGSKGTHGHEVAVFDKSGKVISSGPR